MASRRHEHQNNEARLEQEHQTRMSNYKREIDNAIAQRQLNIQNEWSRLRNWESQINTEHERHTSDLNAKRDAFLANYRRQMEILQRELNEARNHRDNNQKEVNRLKLELQKLRQ